MDTTSDSSTFDPGPLAQVSVRTDGELWTVVFVRDLRHDPEQVWRALTDPAQLIRWAPYTADRDLGRRGVATLRMLDAGDLGELPPAEVTQADRPTLLEYTWGRDLLRWELAQTDFGTRLTLRHTVGDRGMIAKVAAGWHLCVLVAERLLDGAPTAPIRGENAMSFGWADLERAYTALTADGDRRV
jgi:uncharacterized protein YndB with AHSA1/START domain